MDKLPKEVVDFLTDVYFEYGQFSALRLTEMTREEPPLLKARESKTGIITDIDMMAFFRERQFCT